MLDKLWEALEEMEFLHVEVVTLKKAVVHATPVKSRVLDPKAFTGEHDMKVLENFLKDIKA